MQYLENLRFFASLAELLLFRSSSLELPIFNRLTSSLTLYASALFDEFDRLLEKGQVWLRSMVMVMVMILFSMISR